MKITSIKQQLKRPDRYSVFIDSKYSFSLGAQALLDSQITKGTELDEQMLADFQAMAHDDALYAMVLRYIAIRPRTKAEIRRYLARKDSPAPLIEHITNKLSRVGLLDDSQFAAAFVRDRQLLRPTSRRKLKLELQKKQVAAEDIVAATTISDEDERAALIDIVRRKQRQPRYQDPLKLLQYLSRQGFSYGDIKSVLADPSLPDETEFPN